jgi:hypothetical protein
VLFKISRRVEEQGEGVIGDLRALHNFHVGDGELEGNWIFRGIGSGSREARPTEITTLVRADS